jgi:hypothetical protein
MKYVADYVDITPALIMSSIYETSGSFIYHVAGGGDHSVGASGAIIETSATANSYSSLARSIYNTAQLGSPSYSTMIQPQTVGTDFQSFFGIGLLVDNNIPFSQNHIGFKILRVASGAINLYATQGNGSETASSVLTTFAENDIIDLIFKVNGSTSVDYYWRKNGGTLSSVTTLTTNIPTGNMASLQAIVSNTNVATQTNISLKSFSYSR